MLHVIIALIVLYALVSIIALKENVESLIFYSFCKET